MAIECYALLIVNEPLSKEDKAFVRRYKDADAKVSRNIRFQLTRCRLVQPSGTNGSVPHPKWEIVHTIGMSIAESMFSPDAKFVENGDSPLCKLETFCEVYSLPPITDELPFLPPSNPIDDRRIQLKQIRALFPECAKMPLAIALDYVRDRM